VTGQQRAVTPAETQIQTPVEEVLPEPQAERISESPILLQPVRDLPADYSDTLEHVSATIRVDYQAALMLEIG